jgi:tRNA pseudouridine synthase 10
VPAALHTYRLCEHCLRRQGDGAEGFEAVQGKECFVCGGLMDRMPSMAKEAIRTARRYQFETFAVGVSLPEGVQESEDELRSDLKLKGNETIKTQAAKLVAEMVSATLHKNVDKLRPDLTLLVDAGAGGVAVTSRPVFFYGRYTKPPGLSQRRELCRHCSGAGCKNCRNTGFERAPSVEGELRRKFARFTGSERMTFTWLGSEDRESRVYTPGRPFVVEIKNPVRRDLPRRFAARFKGGSVTVSSGRALPSKPVRFPAFRFKTEILAAASSKVAPENLAELRKMFRRAEVRFDRPHDRPIVKMVYEASARLRGKKLVIDAELDGGLPVKRFVSGELVSPSVSEVLKTEVRCRRFDICEVREKGGFEFAEVTRGQKKN